MFIKYFKFILLVNFILCFNSSSHANVVMRVFSPKTKIDINELYGFSIDYFGFIENHIYLDYDELTNRIGKGSSKLLLTTNVPDYIDGVSYDMKITSMYSECRDDFIEGNFETDLAVVKIDESIVNNGDEIIDNPFKEVIGGFKSDVKDVSVEFDYFESISASCKGHLTINVGLSL